MQATRPSVASNTTIDRYDFSFDAKDRLISTSSLTDGDIAFGYDSRDQLTSTNRPGTSLDESFSYDAAGNRQSKTRGSAAAQSSLYGNAYQQNRLQSDALFTYTYDKEGNLLTKKSLGATPLHVTYVWDYRNRLTSVVYRQYDPTQALPEGVTTNPITKQVDLSYDALDRLIGYSVDRDGAGPLDVATDQFVYDGDQIYLQMDSSNRITHRYLAGPGVDQVLIDEVYSYLPSGSLDRRVPQFLVADHQGSVRAVVDGLTGSTLERMEYNGFGELIRATPAAATPPVGSDAPLTPSAVDSLFRYTGRPYFDEIDLQNNRARWYNASTGRFISSDPIGFESGDYNNYRYTGNNATTTSDPSGLWEDSPGSYIAAAGYYVAGWLSSSSYSYYFPPSTPSDIRGFGQLLGSWVDSAYSAYNSTVACYASGQCGPGPVQVSAMPVSSFSASSSFSNTGWFDLTQKKETVDLL